MEQYISKSAVVAEIENRIKELQNLYKENEEKLDSIQKVSILLCIDECKVILSFIGNIEVKEVDIEDVVHGTVDYPLIGCDFPNIYPNYKELKEYCDRKGIKDNDKVKLIIIKNV